MATNFPTSIDDNTTLKSNHATGETVTAANDNNTSDAIKAVETKLGTGSSTPTTAGHVLTVTGAGATAFQAPASSALTVKKAGTTVGARSAINLIEGTNVTMTVADDTTNGEVDITINAAAGAGGYTSVLEEGTALTARDKLNFIGSTVTAADDSVNGRTNVTINAAAATHSHAQSEVTNLTTDLAAKLDKSGGTMTGKITLDGDPTANLHAATKQYVDAVKQGLDVKDSVRTASTANIDLTTGGLLTIDGVTLASNDRVLVKDQTTGSQNGIYTAASGAWTRATDADSSTDVTSGLYVFVTEGTAHADSGWILTTNDPITLDTTALTFTQFSGAGQITAGAGLTKTGNTLDVGAGTGITVAADSIAVTPNSTTQKLEIAKAGVLTGTRKRLNLIEGTNITLTMADDAANDEVDVTIAASGGGSLPTTTKGDLIVHDGTSNVRLPVGGTAGHVLTVDSAEATGLKWAAASGGGGGTTVEKQRVTLVDWSNPLGTETVAQGVTTKAVSGTSADVTWSNAAGIVMTKGTTATGYAVMYQTVGSTVSYLIGNFFDKNPVYKSYVTQYGDNSGHESFWGVGGAPDSQTYNGATHKVIGFKHTRVGTTSTLYAIVGNGTAETAVDVTTAATTAGWAVGDFNKYMSFWFKKSATDVKFYVDATLLATVTTNLPSGALTGASSRCWAIIKGTGTDTTVNQIRFLQAYTEIDLA